MLTPGRLAVLLGLLFGFTGMASSAVTVTLPEVAAEFGVSASGAVWMISAMTVALAVATPVHGRLADMVGIRAPLCFGLVAMSVGAIGAALAPNFAVLVGARVLQGLGAAAVPVLATALITARLEGAERGAALGRVAGFAATLGSLGPTIGGAVEAVGGWRLTVAIPALGLLALPVMAKVAPSGGSRERMDWTGAALVTVAAAGLVLLLQSPSTGALVAGIGAALLLAGAPLLAGRVRRHPHGFLPRAIMTNPTVLRSAFAAAAVPTCWFALLLGVPLAAASWGWTPLQTGLLMVPAAVIGFISPALARRSLARVGARWSIAIACPIAATALLVAALGAALSSPVLLATSVLLVGVAFGIGQPAMLSAVGSAVDPGERGVALGIATLVFLTGASIGAALVGGLAAVIGIPLAFCLLVVLPAAGFGALLLGGPDRVAPAATPAAEPA
ncbi:MFS transporter [Pseudonocardia lacus]|uniref:MFS transporter n=1 Tax=Pseudonocardia lacus TaxID=2835865 RepID=UPI001BDC606F|nr:MFS transporter [Pseudonocardia lacus]